MEITELSPQGVQVVHGYGDGRFRIGDVVHEGPVLVMPEVTLPWEIGESFDVTTLTADHFAPIWQASETFDILLVGTGRTQVFVPPSVRRAVREHGPVMEVMDTGAACRTFNLLLAEARRVAMALLPVD